MDPSFINEGIFHLEVSLFARSLGLKLNKGVLKRLASLPIPDHITPFDFTEFRKNHLKPTAKLEPTICLTLQRSRDSTCRRRARSLEVWYLHQGCYSGSQGLFPWSWLRDTWYFRSPRTQTFGCRKGSPCLGWYLACRHSSGLGLVISTLPSGQARVIHLESQSLRLHQTGPLGPGCGKSLYSPEVGSSHHSKLCWSCPALQGPRPPSRKLCACHLKQSKEYLWE